MYVIFCIYHKICGYQKNSTVSYHLNCFHIKNLKQLLSNNLAIKLNKWISDKKNSTPGGLTSPMPRGYHRRKKFPQIAGSRKGPKSWLSRTCLQHVYLKKGCTVYKIHYYWVLHWISPYINNNKVCNCSFKKNKVCNCSLNS